MHEGFWRQAASGGPRGGQGDTPGSPAGGGSTAAKLKGKRAALPKRKAMRALARATRCELSLCLGFQLGSRQPGHMAQGQRVVGGSRAAKLEG